MTVAPHIRPVLDRAAAAFRRQYGHEPTLAAAAPGRVNLIGEHTDYNGGFVLPIAIDRVCVVVGAPAAAGQATSRVWAEELGQRGEIDTGRSITLHAPGKDPVSRSVEQGSWLSYIAGVMAQFQRRLAPAGAALPTLDLAIASSVPVGSGLSSSAALEVATATLLEQATGLHLDPIAKALLCQAAEHEFAGVPCGIMDQFISVMGRQGHALLIDCRSEQATHISMPPPSRAAILVMDSGIRHALASGEYARRRATCESAAAKLGHSLLRDAGPVDDLNTRMSAAGLNDDERRCVRHVVTENSRTVAAAASLQSGDLIHVGRLMRESHASLRYDYRVSCPELDTLVEAAAAVPGVFGARMTGGGFGGCAIAIAEPDAVSALQTAVLAAYLQRHNRLCEIAAFCSVNGAMAVRCLALP